MKFIHCADLHLDSKMDTLPSDKSKIRRDEILRTFERLADYTENNQVRAVIIAGDMFDTSKVSVKTKGRIISAIKMHPNVDFLYLSGNHDEDNFISGIEEKPNNLKIFGEEWTEFVYEDVVISGISLKGKNSDFIYDRLNLDVNNLNIVVMHGQVAGYKCIENGEVISVPLLMNKNVDYLALGHIHQYSCGKLDNRGVYAYSGCLDGRGFDETGDKGFVLLETGNGKITHKFVPFCSRKFYEVSFSVDGYGNSYSLCEKIVSELRNTVSSENLIKVVLTGERNIDFDIDKDNISSRLNEYFFFAKIYDKTELKVAEEDFENDKSVKGEFVRTVLASNLSEEKKNAIIMCGLRALKGEDVL